MLTLVFPQDWFKQNPLMLDDLKVEANYLKAGGIELVIAED